MGKKKKRKGKTPDFIDPRTVKVRGRAVPHSYAIMSDKDKERSKRRKIFNDEEDAYDYFTD